MAGGPGSGKSHVATELLKQFGLKVIDSDKMFEHLMAKKGLDVGDPVNVISRTGQATRDKGKELIAKQKGWWLDGKLGVVIDGTGRDVEKTAKLRQEMIDLGYGTMMLFVNTELSVAQERNLKRKRTIPADMLKVMWQSVQHNIMKFQQVFGADRFIVIDNSGGLEDPNRKEAFTNVESSIRKFLTAEPRNKTAIDWIKQNKK
jgi:cytidylate kinase